MFRAEKIRIIRKQEVQKQSRRFIWMETIRFLDNKGTFSIVRPENYSYLYFPIAGESGIKSSLSPNLGGDIKNNQNAFLDRKSVV